MTGRPDAGADSGAEAGGGGRTAGGTGAGFSQKRGRGANPEGGEAADGKGRGCEGAGRRVPEKGARELLDVGGEVTMLAPVPTHSSLAQLVEQAAVNRRVAGSSPAAGAIFESDKWSPERRELLGAFVFVPARCACLTAGGLRRRDRVALARTDDRDLPDCRSRPRPPIDTKPTCSSRGSMVTLLSRWEWHFLPSAFHPRLVATELRFRLKYAACAG